MGIKEFMKTKVMGLVSLVATIAAALKFTAVAPGHYVVKKHNEDSLNTVKEKCQEMQRNINVHPEVKNTRTKSCNIRTNVNQNLK